MTKGSFDVIASLLKAEFEGGFCRSKRHHGIRCRLWAEQLSKQNPRFDEYGFLKACGAVD